MTAVSFQDIKEDPSSKWAGISEQAFLGGKISDSAKLEPFVMIEEDVEIGKNSVIGPFTYLRRDTKIGQDTVIGPNCVSEGKGVVIGDRVRIGSHCNFGFGTIIEDMVFIGGHFTGANDNEITWQRKQFTPNPYKIEFGSRIALQCVIGAGVIVRRESVIGMGSVVTHDTKPRSVYYGNPARWRKPIDIEDEINYEKFDLSFLSYNEAVNKYGTMATKHHRLHLLQWDVDNRNNNVEKLKAV